MQVNKTKKSHQHEERLNTYSVWGNRMSSAKILVNVCFGTATWKKDLPPASCLLIIGNQWPPTLLSALPRCCQYYTQTLPNLRSFNLREFKIIVEKLKQYPWNASSETKVAEGYCWAITNAAELPCCGRSWTSVLAFGFQLESFVKSNADIAPLFVTVYWRWLWINTT